MIVNELLIAVNQHMDHEQILKGLQMVVNGYKLTVNRL